jgi:hypothetical protein
MGSYDLSIELALNTHVSLVSETGHIQYTRPYTEIKARENLRM